MCFNECERRKIMNNVMLVGRLTGDLEIVDYGNEMKRSVVTLAVPRTYKNQDGIYETDFLRCVLWNGIAKKAHDYCKKGDMVCIKGRIQVRNYENENNEKRHLTEIIAESIAFVSSTRQKEEKKQD